jgi:hypothetical protein
MAQSIQHPIQILAACVGDCIHVAGILNFLQIAKDHCFNSDFMGPAVPITAIINQIKITHPNIIALSYRLTPKVGERLLKEFKTEYEKIPREFRTSIKLYLGCLPDLARIVEKWQFFHRIFIGGESDDECLAILHGNSKDFDAKQFYPRTLLERIKFKAPAPILRAHFGLPTLPESLEGLNELANAKVLDVISIAPDQAAQEFFHQPEILATRPTGSGGMPIRTRADLKNIYEKTRGGNYPLIRIYSGTRDLLKNAELFNDTVNNAWAAIPLFWYSELDGRSQRPLLAAITENIATIKWHAERNIPVEINDPHQWGLRMAPDDLVVADTYLAARVAKELGVRTYIEQLMFNTPPGVSLKMDLARILAMIEIIEPLVDNNFQILRETRAGLEFFSPHPDVAKGQLALSTVLQMTVKPHIMHIVSYTEASHAAPPAAIIESCKLVQKIISESVHGLPEMSIDPEIQIRKNELLEHAHFLIRVFETVVQQHYPELSIQEGYTHPECLSTIVKMGVWDAPQLTGSGCAKGMLQSRIINGKCLAVNENGDPITHSDRIRTLGIEMDRHP